MSQDPQVPQKLGQNHPKVFNAPLHQQFNQVNVHVQPELPDPERFKAFPEAAQKLILDCVLKEQNARHAWMRQQQSNDHRLNIRNGRYFFWLKITGTIGGFLLALAALIIGYLLIKSGCSATGATILISAAASLVGVAIYGHKQTTKTNDPTESPQGEAEGQIEGKGGQST